MDLNEVLLSGRLGRDAEVRYSSSGNSYCVLSIAESYYSKKETGVKTEWHNVFYYNPSDYVARNLTKGSYVIVKGVLRKDRDKKYVVYANSVRIVGRGGDIRSNDGTVSGSKENSGVGGTNEKKSNGSAIDEMKKKFDLVPENDDDIPF